MNYELTVEMDTVMIQLVVAAQRNIPYHVIISKWILYSVNVSFVFIFSGYAFRGVISSETVVSGLNFSQCLSTNSSNSENIRRSVVKRGNVLCSVRLVTNVFFYIWSVLQFTYL